MVWGATITSMYVPEGDLRRWEVKVGGGGGGETGNGKRDGVLNTYNDQRRRKNKLPHTRPKCRHQRQK